MSEPIYPMSRLCLTFSAVWMVATLAMFFLAMLLAAVAGISVPSGVSVVVQIAAFYYVGMRVGQSTAILPGNGWFWRGALYATLLSLVLSGVLVLVLLLVIDGILDELASIFIPEVVIIMVVFLLVYCAISIVSGRFIMASAARKNFDPAGEF